MNADERRAIGFRLRRVREGLGLDRTQLAERLGVHPGSIARWETGGSVAHRYYLERIADWADVSPEWILNGEGEETAEAAREETPEAETEDVFASLDAVTRFLGGMGSAGQERLRKLDALEGLRRMLTARGMLPDWWYRLREQVESGDL
jgi:transcriptional regulator with XRE-family HTH domain